VNKTISIKRTALHIIIFALGLTAAIAPVTIRNYIAAHDFVLIASHGGIAFYDGNNPDYLKNIGIRGGFGWHEMLEIPQKERLAECITKDSEESAYFYNKGMEFIKGHPIQFLKLYMIKLYHFWNGIEIMSVVDMYFYRQFSPILRILVWDKWLAFPFGIVGPLALSGMILAMFKNGRNQNVILLFLFFISYMLVNTLYVVNDRFRASATPTLLIFAGYAMYWMYKSVKWKLYVKTFLAFIIFLFFVVVCNVYKIPMSAINRAYMHGVMASIAERSGDFEKALREYKKQVEACPDNPSDHAIAHLAVAYKYRGMLDEALRAFKESSHKKPRQPRWYFEIAEILFIKKDYEEAFRYYRRVVDFGPTTEFYGRALFHIGEIYEVKGILKKAINSYQKLQVVSLSQEEIKYKDMANEKLAAIYEKLNLK